MGVVMVNTWVIKPEKQAEFTQMWKRYLKYVKENPEEFKELKSIKLFTQTFGGIYGAYVELVEYESLTDYEKLIVRILKDEGFMKIFQELMLLMEPGTFSLNVWNFVM